jgi:hypothetical protein
VSNDAGGKDYRCRCGRRSTIPDVHLVKVLSTNVNCYPIELTYEKLPMLNFFPFSTRDTGNQPGVMNIFANVRKKFKLHQKYRATVLQKIEAKTNDLCISVFESLAITMTRHYSSLARMHIFYHLYFSCGKFPPPSCPFTIRRSFKLCL